MAEQNTKSPYLTGGALPVYKEAGMTSHDVVGRIRRLFSTRAVGHTGTLDPMAEGILVILIGKCTKCERFLVSDSKEYVASLLLGVTTDTQDSTGTVLSRSETLPSFEEVEKAALTFLGESEQIPPMYSAIKVGGKKLYEYAREGKEIERAARPIYIDSISCRQKDGSDREYTLTASVSSGTYIRTLCADIGERLGCGGVMSSLLRTRTGRFSLSDCKKLSEIEELSPEERWNALITPEKLLCGEKIVLPPFFERLYLSGCEIYQKKIGTHLPLGSGVLVYTADGELLSFGTVKDFPDGSAIKNEIFFH